MLHPYRVERLRISTQLTIFNQHGLPKHLSFGIYLDADESARFSPNQNRLSRRRYVQHAAAISRHNLQPVAFNSEYIGDRWAFLLRVIRVPGFDDQHSRNSLKSNFGSF